MPVSPHNLSAGPMSSGSAFLGLVVLVEILARDLLFGHVGEFKDEIDHLVLIDRRTKLGQRVVIVAIVVPDLLLVPGHLARALDDRTADLFVGDCDLVLFALPGHPPPHPAPPTPNLPSFLPRRPFLVP